MKSKELVAGLRAATEPHLLEEEVQLLPLMRLAFSHDEARRSACCVYRRASSAVR